MYEGFARFYDRVEQDAPVRSARWVSDRISRYRPGARDVLELGCGTGAVLAALPSDLIKVGVDRAPAMLDQARRTGVDAELHEADLTRLALGRRFDVVVCVFDTLNHVPDRSGWTAAFAVAASHLRPGGLFLLDLNTTGRLAELAGAQPWVYDFDGNTLIVDVRESGADGVVWDIRVFEPAEDGRFTLTHELIEQLGVPLGEVAVMLESAGLELLECHDDDGRPATDSSRRAFLVSRRTTVDEDGLAREIESAPPGPGD